MLVTYSLVYLQIPLLLIKRRWILFLGSLLIISYGAAVLARLCILYIAEPILYDSPAEETLWQIVNDPVFLYKVYVISLYVPAVIFFLIKMTKERFVQQRNLERLRKEKNAAELNFLKAQINPHFLFNTLNNLYALSEQGAEEAPEMILKLSEILNYTIYECAADQVPIHREWELIEHYADLESLRFSNRIEVRLISEIDEPRKLIAPLILISIVENAFKYGLSSKIENGKIDIQLNVQKGQLSFSVTNTYDRDLVKKMSRSKNGIGNENLKKQLQLQYPERHQMTIDDSGALYKVDLQIQLN